MSVRARLLLGLVLLGCLGFVAYVVAGGESESAAKEQQVAKTTQWQSSAQCKTCHQDVWNEWYGSHHQIAYLNPEVRNLSDDFRNKECQACHLPQPIAMTGFAQRTLPRQTRPDEGVGCISCHLGADGRIMAAHDVPSAGCAPVANADFMSMRQCESCHNQHYTTDQWRASRFAKENVNCNDCHMPRVERTLADGKQKQGWHHGFPAAHDKAMLKKAGKFIAKVEGDLLVLGLVNDGAGHNYPTEERHRAVDLMYRFIPREGHPGKWQLGYRFRQPYRDEPGENTQLPAGQSKKVTVPIPEDTAAIECRMWYRLKPYIGDDDPASTLLFEQRIEMP